MKNSPFIEKIDAEIQKHHLLNHSFYKLWNEGALKKETIQEYAAQYFNHVSSFPRYLSAIHSNCDDIKVRQLLLENLVDEEKGNENHPELWMRFAEGMGNTRQDVRDTVMMDETRELVETFKKLSKSEKYHIGLAALYCYESMQPEISETKKDGLQKFYGIEDENTLKFFTVHMHADKWHRQVVRKMLAELSNTKEKQAEILEAVTSSLRALNNFLTGMERVNC
ncbi:MAG: CADD family putative folate metabolism protein [Fidelibacterota bacterium]|jgi:pyrroloquinoline-quinone synthase|tara:strand:+ start:5539 stop:6210 length:672 start_codon:yes stop_codon:yes gene_type:complete